MSVQQQWRYFLASIGSISSLMSLPSDFSFNSNPDKDGTSYTAAPSDSDAESVKVVHHDDTQSIDSRRERYKKQ